VKEEVVELEAAIVRGRRGAVTEEVSDCFFALAYVARLLNLNPEIALRSANNKSIRRFTKLEKQLQAQGRRLGTATLDEMEAIWKQVK